MTASGRVIRKWLLALVGLALAAAVVVYLLASSIPPEYSPARLSLPKREKATDHFYRRVFDFKNDGEDVKPYTWSATQEWLNESLDAMDEIAYRGGGSRGRVGAMMGGAGLAEPAIALADGAVTLLVRSLEYDKIVSATFRFDFAPDGGLHVKLVGARIGRLPVPLGMIRAHLSTLRQTVARRLTPPATAPRTGANVDAGADVGKVLARVIAAIDREPIAPELTWPSRVQKRVRITRIDVADGVLTLHVLPVLKPGPPVSGAPALPFLR